jgi:hypothetical protein
MATRWNGDEDGNILYSLKNIGIGKISRADGHIIWQVDRKKQKINKELRRTTHLPAT